MRERRRYKHSSGRLADIEPDGSMEWTGFRVPDGDIWWANYSTKASVELVAAGSHEAMQAAERLFAVETP